MKPHLNQIVGAKGFFGPLHVDVSAIGLSVLLARGKSLEYLISFARDLHRRRAAYFEKIQREKDAALNKTTMAKKVARSWRDDETLSSADDQSSASTSTLQRLAEYAFGGQPATDDHRAGENGQLDSNRDGSDEDPLAPFQPLLLRPLVVWHMAVAAIMSGSLSEDDILILAEYALDCYAESCAASIRVDRQRQAQLQENQRIYSSSSSSFRQLPSIAEGGEYDNQDSIEEVVDSLRKDLIDEAVDGDAVTQSLTEAFGGIKISIPGRSLLHSNNGIVQHRRRSLWHKKWQPGHSRTEEYEEHERGSGGQQQQREEREAARERAREEEEEERRHELEVGKGCTILHLCCLRGYHKMVTWLIKQGADTQAVTDAQGVAPVQMSVAMGHKFITRSLSATFSADCRYFWAIERIAFVVRSYLLRKYRRGSTSNSMYR
jgi:hypothetical protein